METKIKIVQCNKDFLFWWWFSKNFFRNIIHLVYFLSPIIFLEGKLGLGFHCFNPLQDHREPGAYSSSHHVRDGVHPEQIANQLQPVCWLAWTNLHLLLPERGTIAVSMRPFFTQTHRCMMASLMGQEWLSKSVVICWAFLHPKNKIQCYMRRRVGVHLDLLVLQVSCHISKIIMQVLSR